MKRIAKKLFLLIKVGLLLVIGSVICYQVWLLGWVVWWNSHDPVSTRFMQTRLSAMRVADPGAQLQHSWVPYSQISAHLKRAVIASEDAKFIDHEGFDWDGIQQALARNRQAGRIVAGGSTITQQLAKNLFLSPSKTPWRKGQEMIITYMLENIMDKRRILEIYLNVIEWGDGVFGAEAAARYYFRVGAAQLSPQQAAQLAAMVPEPRFYDKNRRSPNLRRKTAIIMSRMAQAQIP